ncbi:hypothetical protein A1O1_05011 [Capronia coronata CBS 617.96]|uniref:SCP domain-containing protein n=1 Tax=Capronia coronata CBS 617.96 TaxID=1182541 RepID=W9Y6C3_9EURO|nr:uncharacterized protein A1O1_05011 [Capronia coronata CBS 617.96]EXJ88083.1 hypothetical protein A1O1_05011 [Capronia coronata CBS 617.96]
MQFLGLFMFALGAAAQSISISISYSYTATVTATVIETITTCPCPTTTTTLSSSILLPDGTITPSFPSSSTVVTTTTSLTGVVLPDNTIAASITTSTSFSSATAGSYSSPSAPVSSISTFTTSTISTTSSTTTTTSGAPIVTNEAYINTILLHHNIHRTNHSANALTWSPSLADTARVLAQTCVYGHVTNINGGGYGQNIGAGYPATPLGMGNFVTEGLYNGEVNNYVSYGSEPDLSQLDYWGHFTQIVWKSTSSVGCYTADCTASGLGAVDGSVPPYFTVCNYAPPGMCCENIYMSDSVGDIS